MIIFWWHSLRYQLKKPLLWACLGAMALLLCWSLFHTAQAWNDYVSQHRQWDQAQRNLWEGQGELNPHSAAHHGLYAFKTWQPLSLLEPGLHAYLGSAVFLEAHHQNVGRFSPAQDQLRLSEVSVFTPAALFQHAVPLVIILLGYGLISDLRSQGTLQFLMAQQLSRSQLFISQVLVLYALLLIMLFPVGSYALVLLMRSGAESSVWHPALFAASYFFYWGLFIHLTLLASAYFKQSRQALWLMFSLWVVNGFALPRSLMLQQNLPAYSVLETQIRRDIDALPDWSARTIQEEQRLRERYHLGPQAPLPVNLEAEVLKASEKEETAVYNRHMQALNLQYQKQLDTYYRWRYIVPFLALQQVSQGVSQSDFAAHTQFLNAAEAYRQAFVLHLNEALARQKAEATFSYTADSQLWRSIPSFQSPQQVPAERIAQWVMSGGTLMLWWLLSFGVIQIYKSRYGVLS